MLEIDALIKRTYLNVSRDRGQYEYAYIILRSRSIWCLLFNIENNFKSLNLLFYDCQRDFGRVSIFDVLHSSKPYAWISAEQIDEAMEYRF